MGYQALLFCSDEKLARVVSQVFSELDFEVDPVTEPFAAVKKLMAQHYDAIVVDCDNEQNSALLFKSARNSTSNQGSLAIGLVEGQAGVAKAYRIGANLVLTKPINVEQAKGTLRVARGLIRKNSESTPAASHAAAATAGPTPVAAPAPTPTPTPTTPSIQSPNRIVEAFPSLPTRGRSPEFETTASPVASSAESEEKPPSAAAPARDWSSLVAQSTTAPVALSSSKADRDEITITEAPKPTVLPVVTTTSSRSGAAAAPARAKEVVAPAKKQVEKDAGEESAKKSAKIEADTAPQPTFASNTGSVYGGPSFILGDDANGSGGTKKILVAAVVLLVLAGTGYFGWTRFGHSQSASIPQLVTTTQPKPAAPVPDSAPVTTSSPATSAVTSPEITASTSPVPKSSPAELQHLSTGSSAPTRIVIRPELDAQEFASAPLLVKSAATSVKTHTEESAAQLPSPLAVSAPAEGNLSGVLTSAPSAVPRPTLAQTRISQGVSQGLLIKRVQPRYPAGALATHIEGAVQIEATISKEGFVINPKVLRGDRMLATAALEAVRQWRYKPYYLDGAPLEIQTEITINFKAR